MERLNYYNPNIKFDRKALTEVYGILEEYDEGVDEIPEKYMWVIEDNMDKDYVFITDDFDNTNLRKDTKEIITYLYTNFLSEPEEREVLKQLEKIQYKEKLDRENKEAQEMKSQLFNNKNIEEKVIFEENVNQNISSNLSSNEAEKVYKVSETSLPTEYKETFFHNVLNKIKEFFRNIF